MKNPMDNSWLHRYTLLLAVCTLFLVVAGASVTSNQAGLSVPDWPLSYGKLMPEMKGGVFYEHGHRIIASTVGFLTVILAVWLWRVESRRWMKRLGFIALLAVTVQGVLGGMTVLFMLPKPVSISHACLAQLFFATTVAIALFTSPGWNRGPEHVFDTGWPSLRTLAVLAPALVLAQIALGAAYRHQAISIMPHVLGAMAVTFVVLTTSIFALASYPTHRALSRAAWILIGVTSLQALLGILAYIARVSSVGGPESAPSMVFYTVTHVATGALTMAASVTLSIQILRNVRPHAAAATSGSGLPVAS